MILIAREGEETDTPREKASFIPLSGSQEVNTFLSQLSEKPQRNHFVFPHAFGGAHRSQAKQYFMHWCYNSAKVAIVVVVVETPKEVWRFSLV